MSDTGGKKGHPRLEEADRDTAAAPEEMEVAGVRAVKDMEWSYGTRFFAIKQFIANMHLCLSFYRHAF